MTPSEIASLKKGDKILLDHGKTTAYVRSVKSFADGVCGWVKVHSNKKDCFTLRTHMSGQETTYLGEYLINKHIGELPK